MQKEDNNMTAMNEVNTVNERNRDMEGKAVTEKRRSTESRTQMPCLHAPLRRDFLLLFEKTLTIDYSSTTRTVSMTWSS